MKVYIIEQHEDSEGGFILGVFDSFINAKKYLDTKIKKEEIKDYKFNNKEEYVYIHDYYITYYTLSSYRVYNGNDNPDCD